MINELPVYPNPFIGRGHHLQAIGSLLQAEDKRLITLFGPGGIGKTRLAVRVGEVFAGAFAQGVCFVPLDAVTDPEQVPMYLGYRLGLKAGFNSTWTEVIMADLADKQLLLILDNLEQIPDSADLIAELLDACPCLKVLATSREVLGLPQEVEYQLDSLNRPNPRLFPRPEDLLKFDAVDLFVQKARRARPDFQLNEANALAVVEICHELEGLPLPIELAASRIKLLSPSLILSKLRSSTELLKTQSKRVTYRHQNIRNTIQWSYDLLSEEEQQIFQQLSVFRGGFSLEAIEAVCTGHDPLELVESFINKSLIVKGEEVYDSPRFRMLKLIRDFGLEQLQHQAEKDLYYFHFARYFIHFVEQLDAEVRNMDTRRWIALLEAEYENFGVALDWLREHQAQEAGRLGAGLWRFYLIRGFLREGLQMVNKLLALPLEDQVIRARLLEGAGTLLHNVGDYLGAVDCFSNCLSYWEGLQDKAEMLKILNHLAWASWRIGNYARTVAYAEQVLPIAKEIHDRQGWAKAINNLAWVRFHQGRYGEAEELQRQVLEVHTQMNNLRGSAFAYTNLAWALIRNGKLIEAEHCLGEGIRRFEQLMDQQLLTFSKVVRAEYFLVSGRSEAAKALLLEDCLPNFERMGDIWGIVYSHNLLGRLYFLENEPGSALSHLNRAVEFAVRSHDKMGQATACFWLSQVHLALGDAAAAEPAREECLLLAAGMECVELFGGNTPVSAAEAPVADDMTGSAIFGQPVIDDPFYRRARKLVEAHLSDPNFSVEEFCRALRMSHSQVHRKISELTGLSAGKFMRMIRLEKAKALLADPELTITAVAFDTGFRDVDYFHRVFKQVFGITPGEVRKASGGR